MMEAYEDFSVWTPTVLVIDDETRVRSVLRRDFEGLGIRVYRAESGREGVRLYRETPGIDLVLIDLEMPGLDGPQTLHELHRVGREHGRAVRACFLGTHERCDVEDLLAFGAELVLSKPLGLAGIARIGAELLGVAACDVSGISDFGEAGDGPPGYDRAGEGPRLAASSGPPLPGGKVAGLGVFGDWLMPAFSGVVEGEGCDAADW